MSNYLLKKTGLGEIRKGFHDLPDDDHIYGKPLIRDNFGTREVIRDWGVAQLSASQQGSQNYVAMNREGIKKGYISPKEIFQYRADNQIKTKVKEGKKFYDIQIPNEDFAYGIENKPSTPIKNVICNRYASQDENLRAETKAVMKLMKEQPKYQPTVQLPERKKKQPIIDRKKEIKEHNFKLTQFQKVPSKVKPLQNRNH